MARFSVQGVFNYSMLTLSDHERVLYVGAREALFALDPNDISRQLRPQVTQTHKHMYTHFKKAITKGDSKFPKAQYGQRRIQEKQFYPQHCLTVTANTPTLTERSLKKCVKLNDNTLDLISQSIVMDSSGTIKHPLLYTAWLLSTVHISNP